MKKLISITLLLFVVTASFSQTNYYVDSIGGNDGNNGTSTGTAWKTVGKVNSSMGSFVSGDSILFKSGNIFHAPAAGLTVSKSSINFGAYGAGASPIITGLTTVSGWSSIGSGLYTVDLDAFTASPPSALNMVTFDGYFKAMVKYPKGNQGYYNVSSATGTAPNFTITSNTAGPHSAPAFSSAANVVGGEICYRPEHWVLWRGTVTAQTASTISFTAFPSTGGGTAYSPTVRALNYGFFLQNSPALLTSTYSVQLGEWAYNGSSHLLTMYFGAELPTNHTIQVATTDILVAQSGTISSVSFNHINFRGANSYVVNFNGATNIKINACRITHSGLIGIFGNGVATGWQVTNDTITNINSIGIQPSSGGTGWTVSNNWVDSVGAIAGMGGSGESAQYSAIKTSQGSTISNNKVTNTGYISIYFKSTNNTVSNNFVNNFGFVKDDAAGIYSNGLREGANTGSKVFNNIVLNGTGAPLGTPDFDMRTQGIYGDDGASNLEVYGNTVAHIGVGGFYCHNCHDYNVHHNTFFDCGLGSEVFYNDDLNTLIRNITWTNNINFAKTSSQLSLSQSPQLGSTSTASYFTRTDSNYYCRPIAETSVFSVRAPNSATYTLPTWKTFTGKEALSKVTPKLITDTSSAQLRFYYNETASPKVFSFPGQTWIDVRNVAYPASITLQPYTSAILLFSNNISGTPLSVSLQATTNPLMCYGNTTNIIAQGTGGTTPYKFKIDNSSYIPAGGSTMSFTVSAGTHTVTIQDASLAVATAAITITQPTQIAVSESHTSILVNGGTSTVTVSATGGSSGYTYSLNGTTYQSSNSFSGVLAGNYTAYVKDANGCINTLAFSVSQPSVLVLSLSASSIACNGGTSTITATASGGTTPYQYRIGAGANQSSNLFTGRTAGTYTVTVQDAGGSVVSSQITITQPQLITISLSYGTSPATVNVTASGGVAPFTYSMNGTTYQSSSTFSNVTAGSYTMYVKDANGCIQTKAFTVLPPPLRVSLSVGTITCNGNTTTATATPTGGVPTYTYLWSNSQTVATASNLSAGTITLHVADNSSQVFDTSFIITQPNPIVVSATFGTAPATVSVSQTGAVGTPSYKLDNGTYQAGSSFSGVAAGTHTVYVRDQNLCVGSYTFTVLSGGTALAISSIVTNTPLACNGDKNGTITVTATGGTAPYRYKLSFESLWRTSNVISGVIGAGTYTVIVADNTNATVSGSTTITQPSIINYSLAYGTAPATVTVNGVTGGVGSKTYSLDGGVYQVSNSFSSVAAGTHTMRVKDANGCIVAKSFTVLTSGLAVSLSVGTISCNAGSTSVAATVTGGQTPYFYLWSNNQTTATATGLTAGTISLHVTDNASHVLDTAFILTQPSAISISNISFSPIGVNGGSTTVSVTASGGVGSLTYSLDSGTYQSSNSFSGVLAGNHTMDVKDANGCMVRRLFSITQPGVLIIAVAQLTTISCYGDSASMGVTASGGTPPYIGVDTFNVAAGTRTYTVTDVFGATASQIVTVTQPTAIVVSVTTGTITVRGGTTYVKIVGTGGTGSYTFQLDNGGYSSTDSITGVLAGNHVAYVKDANGCISQFSFTITEPKKNRGHMFIPSGYLLFKPELWLVKRKDVDVYSTII